MSINRLIFIVNEFSRKGKKVIPQLKKTLSKYEVPYEVYTTKYEKHATLLAEELSKSLDDSSLLVAVGGDGTLNEVVMGSVRSGKDFPVAYIPTGSGNDFARSRNLSKSIDESIKMIFQRSKPVILDILTCEIKNDHLVAVNSVGFGLDGMVISKIDKSKNKQTIGKSSYLLSVISAFFSQKTFGITLKSEEVDCHFDESLLVVCANHKFFGGGIPIHPLADATDGWIDIVVAEKVNFFELLSLIYKVVVNETHLQHKKMHSFRVHSCDLIIDSPQFGQRDGELIKLSSNKVCVQTMKKNFWL